METTRSWTYLFIRVLVFFLFLSVLAFLQWHLLKLFSVLEEQRVSQARAQEQVSGLHGHHLEEASVHQNSSQLNSDLENNHKSQPKSVNKREQTFRFADSIDMPLDSSRETCTPAEGSTLTQVVRTLAAALSKWKARTLLMPSVMSVNT